MEARSSVVVMTYNGAAVTGTAPKHSAAAPSASIVGIFMKSSLRMSGSERVGAVGADGEQELEEQLVGLDALAVAGVAVLAADLAELARPPGQQQRGALVHERGIVR